MDLNSLEFKDMSPDDQDNALDLFFLLPDIQEKVAAAIIDTDPDPSPKAGARRLRRYWTKGEGAAKIAWGTEGDWTRCVAELEKYVGEGAKGLCNVYHKAATGMYPGDKNNKSDPASDTIADGDSPMTEVKDMPDGIEYKSVSVMGMSTDEGDGIVSAIISVTGLVDNVKDVIKPGAYEKTLATRTPKGIWSHSWDTPVSRTIEVKELLPGDPALPKTLPGPDARPWPREAGALQVKTQFNLGTQRGREAYSDVVFYEDQQEWSIGYQVPVGGATIDSKTGQRHISYLELFEYSPVLFGAMPAARTTSFKEAQMAMKSLHLGESDTDVEVKEVMGGPAAVADADPDVCPDCGKNPCECEEPKPVNRKHPTRPAAEPVSEETIDKKDDAPVEVEEKAAEAPTVAVPPIAEDSADTYESVIEEAIGPRDGQPPILADIYQWAGHADDAEDDDAELEALTGLMTQIEKVLNSDTDLGDKVSGLESLLKNLEDVFGDFDETDDEEADPDEVEPDADADDADKEEKSIPEDILEIKDALAQFAGYIDTK